MLNDISVIIPTYNHGKSIDRTLLSVMKNSKNVKEVIVIDDGSTDDTRQILIPWLDRVTYVHQNNKGANFARNAGLSLAKGEFVIVLDADVELFDGSLDAMRDKLINSPEHSYVYGGFYFGFKYFHPLQFDEELLKKFNFIHTSALVRRKDHSGFDVKIKRFQDWDVWLTMLKAGKIGICLDMPLYKVHVDGLSRIGSSWLPSFIYKLPWPIFGYTPSKVVKYFNAKSAIYDKYNLWQK